MNAPPSVRRAMLLVIGAATSACDIAELVTDPAPRFEQVWNLPTSNTTIPVSELLPDDSSATVLPDSTGFALRPADLTFTSRLGAGCVLCEAMNGTTAIKPAFRYTTGVTGALATDVVSARIILGTATVRLTNNLTFDPLRVRASGTQGHMVIVIHSGSLVLGRDSISGETTTWAPGSQLDRTITLATGDARSGLTVDVTFDSPQGDTPVRLDADRSISATASVPVMHAPTIGLLLSNKLVTSSETDLDLDGIDENITNSVTRGAIRMSVTNPFAVTGDMDIKVKYGSAGADTLKKSVSMPVGVAVDRMASFDESEMDQLLGKRSILTFGGVVSTATPITVGPRQKIVIENRIQLTIRTGG